MMDRDTFMAAVPKALKERLPNEFANCKIKQGEYYKTNRKVNALSIEMPGKENNASPNFNLDDEYKYYENTGDFNSCIDRMARIIVQSKDKNFDLSLMNDVERLKENIIMQLINTDSNKELLNVAPHREINDCSVVYRVLMQNTKDGIATVLIDNNMLKAFDMTESDLFAHAQESTKKLLPPVIKPISEVLPMCIPDEMREMFQEMGMPEMPMFQPEEELYILTNTSGVHGAAQMLYADNLQQVADKVGNDIYVLPSSVHEVLCVNKDKMSVEELQDMVREVNATIVDLADRLSNQVYLYDRTERTLTMVSDGKNRDIRDGIDASKVAEKNMEYEVNSLIR